MKSKKKEMNEILHDIALKLLRKYKFKTVAGKKVDEIYVYREGIYDDCGKEVIRVEVEKELGKICKTHYVREVMEKIARKSLVERGALGNNDVNLICLENGVLDMKSMKLLGHSPDYRFMSKIPVKYVSGAKCFKFLGFLEDVMYADDVLTCQEWFGYCLYRRYPIKKALICKGPKNTGKTQWINVLREFIGGRNVANKSLQRLSEGKWQVANLYNKHANVSDELSEKAISDVDVFKELTGDSPIDGEIKFGDSFNFRNYAKLTFAANKIPYVSVEDNDEAYFDRWLIFEFDNRFESSDKVTELEVWRKIVSSEEEMSGILNWALVGLKRLLKQNYFSYSKDWKAIRDIMKKENPVYGFIKSCCSEELGEKVSKLDLFERYKEYCLLSNKSALYEIWKFGIELKKNCEYIDEVNDGGVAYWKNVRYEIPDLFE